VFWPVWPLSGDTVRLIVKTEISLYSYCCT